LNALGHELGEPVAGWVRNLPEGAVEVLVRAAPAVVDRIEGLLSGSLSYPVRVETLSRAPASEAEISEDFSVFRVLRD
jgi:acylphosphatase